MSVRPSMPRPASTRGVWRCFARRLTNMKDPITKKDANARFLPLRWQTHQQVDVAIDETFNSSPKAYKRLARMLGFDKARKKKKKKK